MMPLMSLSSLLNILRPNRAPAAGAPGDDNVYLDPRALDDGPQAGNVVGVGSSVNRTLTAGVARAGAGVELILAPGEDAERLVSGLLARTAAPLVTHVEVRGEAILANAPAYLPDLYAGSPALISLQLRPEGGQLELSGHTADGPWREVVTVPACGEGQGTAALAALFARETVEDLELAHATTVTDHAAIDRAIEDLGLRYQIATRLTTWVAVSQDATVDPSRPSRREVVAHEVPQGVSVSGLGLRAPAGAPMPMAAAPLGRAQASAGSAPSSVKARLMSTEIRERGAPPAANRYAMPPPPGSPAPSSFAGSLSRREAEEEPESEGDFGDHTGGLLGSIGLDALETSAEPQPSEAPADEDDWVLAPRSAPMRMPEAAPEPAKKKDEAPARAPRARGISGTPMAEAAAAAPVLRARLRHRDEGLLSLEIEVRGALAWSAGAAVVVHLAGGRQVTARVLPQTTGDGSYSDGQVIRLVIDLGAAEAEATPIAVLVAGRLIPIVVE